MKDYRIAYCAPKPRSRWWVPLAAVALYALGGVLANMDKMP